MVKCPMGRQDVAIPPKEGTLILKATQGLIHFKSLRC